MLKKLIDDFFKKPSAEVLAQQDLEEARRCLIDSQNKESYHRKMVEYYSERIHTLEVQLREGLLYDN
jgi:hypothetical protein